jgi:hypothetical protein
MSEYDESNNLAQTAVAVAGNALEEGERALDEVEQGMEQSYWDRVEYMRELNLELIDMAEANAGAVFDLARQIARANGPSDIMTSWTAHGRKQFEMLAAQTNELTALGQKFVSTTAAQIMHTAQQAFGEGF